MTTLSEARAAAGARSQRLHLFARPLTSYYLVVGSSLLLVGIGLVMVLSASSVESFSESGSSFAVFERQLLWVAIGLPLMWLAARLPPQTFRLLAYPLLLGSAVLLILVLVPGIGITRNFATRWLAIGPFTVQPSELAKLALALWGADLYARKQKLLGDWRHLLMPLLPVALFLAVLIMLEPDMGTTLTLMAVVFGLLWVAGAALRMFAGMVAVAASLSALLAVAEPYRWARLVGFVDPCAADVRLNEGFQGCQGLIAIASGGWFGVGLGGSRQKWDYLPNAHTDYIFAIIGEELGLLGTLVVLALFGVLAYSGIRIANRHRDPFVRLAATGITAWLVMQAVVNMGAVTGLLPITGIPLPLISFGGSSLGVSLFAIGMLASFARNEPGAREALLLRGPTRVGRVGRAIAAYYGFGPGPRRRRRGQRRPAARPAAKSRTTRSSRVAAR